MEKYDINPKLVFDADSLPDASLVVAMQHVRQTKYEFFKLNGKIYFITRNCCHQTSLKA